MKTPTLMERVIALEPTSRDDFADEPTVVPIRDTRPGSSRAGQRRPASWREPGQDLQSRRTPDR